MEPPKPTPTPRKSLAKAVAKPVPKPRTPRAGPLALEILEEEDELGLGSIPDAPNLGLNKGRETINIFKLANNCGDPFNGFDDQFGVYCKPPPPIPLVQGEENASCSSSSSSDDEDYEPVADFKSTARSSGSGESTNSFVFAPKLPHTYDPVAMDEEGQPQVVANSPPTTTPASSIIAEFDPLLSNGNVNENNNSLLEVDGDHRYEYIDSEEATSSSNNEEEGEEEPPPPPRNGGRSPNLNLNLETPPTEQTEEDYEPVGLTPPPNSNLNLNSPANTNSQNGGGGDYSFFRRFSTKLRLNSIKEEGGGLGLIPPYRPCIVYSSPLWKLGGVTKFRKEWSKRRAVLSQGALSFHNDKAVALSSLPLEKILGVGKREGVCGGPPGSLPGAAFELSLSGGGALVLGAVDGVEACRWMAKLIEAHSESGVPKGEIDRAGWALVKEGVSSGEYAGAVLVLSGRNLYVGYHSTPATFLTLDLRKARSLELREEVTLVLHVLNRVLYIQCPEKGKVARGWERALSSAATTNGPALTEMQLSGEEIPVVVDKCLDFLYAYGLLSEGIYRQSGSNSRIGSLLTSFRGDAWAVSLSPKDYSPHDVAGALKRFFRTLPEPLVTDALYPKWIEAAGLAGCGAKSEAYSALLASLPPINYAILKRLIAHLYAVHEHAPRNLMSLTNLAPIWGPTLCSVDAGPGANSYDSACAECEVLKDLIEGYHPLFRVGEEEVAKERRMADALQHFHGTSSALRGKPSGDIRVGLALFEPKEVTTVTLGPGTTSPALIASVLASYSPPLRRKEELGIWEVVGGEGGALSRPLHPQEHLLDTLLRWNLWPLEQRKENYFILKKNLLYPALVPYVVDLEKEGEYEKSFEVKYAEGKSSSYRKGSLKYSYSKPSSSSSSSSSPSFKLRLLREGKLGREVGAWKGDELSWYMGVDPKRSPPAK